MPLFLWESFTFKPRISLILLPFFKMQHSLPFWKITSNLRFIYSERRLQNTERQIPEQATQQTYYSHDVYLTSSSPLKSKTTHQQCNTILILSFSYLASYNIIKKFLEEYCIKAVHQQKISYLPQKNTIYKIHYSFLLKSSSAQHSRILPLYQIQLLLKTHRIL